MTTNNALFNVIAKICKNSNAKPVSSYYANTCGNSLSDYITMISTQSSHFYPQFIYFIDEKEQLIYMERGNRDKACQILLKFNDNKFRFDSYAFPSDRDPDDYDEDDEDDVKFWSNWNKEHDIEIYGSVVEVLKLFEDFTDESYFESIISAKNESNNSDINNVLTDFIYKIDDSSKLDVQSSYESVDAFFEDNSTDSYVENACLTIIAVDTKVPILKLEKAQVKDQNVFKFIIDITNDNGEDYIVRAVIDSKEKFNQLLQSTIDSLRNYPQFIKYADDLENCR